MNADELLKTLQGAGIPVNGMQILDPRDSASWVLSGDLSDAQHARAVQLLHAMLLPAAPSEGAVAIPLRLFLLLLTPGEYFAWTEGAVTDPALRYYLALLRAAPSMDPAEPWVSALLDYGVRVKAWTTERAAEILATAGG